jgi:hypothetical protein
MAKYATGKYAKAISDRSGMEFPYKEMVREWNGAFVHVSEFEPKIFWYRLLKKQMCWEHTSYTISCLVCREIRR